MMNFTNKSASQMRRRILKARFRSFLICVLVRRRNQSGHIAGCKRVADVFYLLRFNYISIDIYTDPYKGRPNIYDTYKKRKTRFGK